MYELDPVTIVASFILTWSIGLAPPLVIRYAIVKAPMDRWPAIGTCVFFWFINIIVFTSLGSHSKTHTALTLIAFVSYWILRKAGTAKEQAQHSAAVNEASVDGTTSVMRAAALGKTKQTQELKSAESNIDAANKRGWISTMNPFRCKSEGMRRISIVLSAVSVLAWFIFAGVASHGFTGMGEKPLFWLFLLAVPFGAYLLVMALRLLAIWIVAGFRSEDNP